MSTTEPDTRDLPPIESHFGRSAALAAAHAFVGERAGSTPRPIRLLRTCLRLLQR